MWLRMRQRKKRVLAPIPFVLFSEIEKWTDKQKEDAAKARGER